MGRILSIDFGLRRLGLAISDERQRIASPLDTIELKKTETGQFDKMKVALMPYLDRFPIEKIVVGLPLKLNQEKSAFTETVLKWIAFLKQHFTIPIIEWDERLTTREANRLLQMHCRTRKKRAQYIDRVSATLILQQYLDVQLMTNNETV